MSASDDSASVEGIWRKAGTAAAHPARLTVDPAGAATIASPDGAVLATAPLASATISARVGRIPRHVTFDGAGDFETPDNDGIDRLSAAALGRRPSLVPGLEAFRPRMAVFVVLTIALCVAIYRYALPVLVEVAVAVTPPVVTELMSQSAFISLDKSIFEPSTLEKPRQDAISSAFQTIAALTPRGKAATGTGKPAYVLHFRGGGVIGPNAFALPDGTIVLTDELVTMANDDEMVLGVLAHEIGHVDHEHSLRQLYRAAGVATLIMLIGGDIGSGTEDILIQGAALASLSYSRSAESEADRYSVELMHEAGRDPAAIVRFFELIRDRLGDSATNDFFSTHPATPERIEETRRYAAEVTGKLAED